MKIFAAIAGFALLAATAPVWLDAKVPTNWNVAGSNLPAAPGPRDAELAPGGRCSATIRPPSTPEDRATVRRGWFLIGPYERYGGTSIVLGTANADGMCRPNAFQGFVFVNGVFVGTIAPHPMDARSDASLSGLGVTLFNAQDMTASFTRYDANDPLCCPHATTIVEYKINGVGSHAVLVPVSASTSKNSP
jgi:hypothetical protein